MTKSPFRVLLTGTLLAAGLAGSTGVLAGGDHGKSYSFGEPGAPRHVDRTIHIAARDMEFGISTLNVRTGQTIRFVVTNAGEIGHDFTIGPPRLQAAHRKEMKAMAANGHRAGMTHDDPNAVYLKPGETKELIWKFEGAGRLEFACNVPGHYEAGMKGRLDVVRPRATQG